MDQWTIADLREEIEEYKNFKAGGGVAAEDKAAGLTLLQGLEDEALFDVASTKKKMDKNGNDKRK
jgi:hypothetical protein